MKPKTKPTAIGDILSKFFQNSTWKKKTEQYSLWEHWETIVGKEAAKHARPERWQNDMLIVQTDHPVWIQELKMREPEILEKIRKYCPKLTLNKILWR